MRPRGVLLGTGLTSESRTTSSEADDDSESDTHDDCPFRLILNRMVRRRAARAGGRGRRAGEVRGRAKTVRFADGVVQGTVVGGASDCGRPQSSARGRRESSPPRGNDVVDRGRFYRRSDGRFVSRGGVRLDPAGVYGPIPYTGSHPVTPQDIIRNVRYRDRNVYRENHDNCPFRELLRIRPRQTTEGKERAWEERDAPGGRRTQRKNLSVKGAGASTRGLKTPGEDQGDAAPGIKWPQAREGPVWAWGPPRRPGTLPDLPLLVNGWTRPPSATRTLQLHGVGCRYRRVPCPLPWFVQCDVAEPGPLYLGVLPGLYVGNFRDSKDPEQLKMHNISHILSIHDNARKLPCNSDKEYLCILASDSPGQNLMQYFPACNDFIHTARLKGGAVLIHCLAGMSRSVTVAVVYVMCVTSLSWRDALKAVRGARNVANPNVGFLKQLQDFENERMAEERRRLRAKYPSVTLEEDEQVAKQLLASYYHSLSLGEMCEGNCPPGVTCPRGLCHPSRRVGLFRRNSRESSGSRSSSPSRRSTSPSPSPSSPGSSPVSPRRGCPVSPSPLTRRSGSSSPQLTPPQPSSPQKSKRRSSSPSRSPRHNTSPLASPKRSTSPTSPKRGVSPVRSQNSSPVSTPVYGSSPTASPKHTYASLTAPRHTYTSPPGSPKRCASPILSQNHSTSPYSSPKRSVSAPNSPQRSMNRASHSPKGIFRHSSLWHSSSLRNDVENRSAKHIWGVVAVDNNRDFQQNERELRAPEERSFQHHLKPEDDARGLTQETTTSSASLLSKQTSLPICPSQEHSPSHHIQRQASLPPQPTQSSHPCHPSVLGSYLQIYRQSSLPEEESEVSQRHPSSVTTSDQQLYRWITRPSQPSQAPPCPYDALFRKASLQESRYKYKPQAQNANTLKPETNAADQNSNSGSECDHQSQRTSRSSSPDRTKSSSRPASETSSLTSSPQHQPPTNQPLAQHPSGQKLPLQNPNNTEPMQNVTAPQQQIQAAPQQRILKSMSPKRAPPPLPPNTPPPLPPNKPKYTPTGSKGTSHQAQKTSSSEESKCESLTRANKSQELLKTLGKSQSLTSEDKPELPLERQREVDVNLKEHERELPPGKENKTEYPSENSVGFSVKQDHKLGSPLKQDHKPPLKRGSKTGSPMKQDHKPGSSLEENHKPGSSLKENRRPESPLKQDCKPDFPLKQDQRPGSPLTQDHKPGSPLKNDCKPGSPLRQDNRSGATLKRDQRPGSPLTQSHKTDSHAKLNQTPASHLKQAHKPGFSVKADHDPDSPSVQKDKPCLPKRKSSVSDPEEEQPAPPAGLSSSCPGRVAAPQRPHCRPPCPPRRHPPAPPHSPPVQAPSSTQKQKPTTGATVQSQRPRPQIPKQQQQQQPMPSSAVELKPESLASAQQQPDTPSQQVHHQPATTSPPGQHQPATTSPPVQQQAASTSPPVQQQPNRTPTSVQHQPATTSSPEQQQPASASPPKQQLPASTSPPEHQQPAKPSMPAQHQPARPSTPIQQQPRSSPALPQPCPPQPSPAVLPHQPSCPPCLPIQPRSNSPTETLSTCPFKPSSKSGTPKPPSSGPPKPVNKSRSSLLTQDPGTSVGGPGLNAPPSGASRPRQHLTVSGASQSHQQQRHSPHKTVICSVSKTQQSQPVVSRILQEKSGKASHKSKGTPADIPRTSEHKKQEKVFEQFHELFKKCSVKNVPETAGGSQSESSGRAMTHTQNISTSTGTRAPLPQ